uniref:Uncharacterized protein n=1 Tax=Timema cristinae TaxID=61476 RepID=A0A7R9CP55_TIMCR|nr:unnamed protein product [Timema cristinae]
MFPLEHFVERREAQWSILTSVNGLVIEVNVASTEWRSHVETSAASRQHRHYEDENEWACGKLVRVHAGGSVGKPAPPRIPHSYPLLGPLLQEGLRMDRESRPAVQPAPGADGGWIHHVQWIL